MVPGPEILYRDDSILVLDKPSGLLVHRGWGRDETTLVDIARERSGSASIHPVHRLDRGTSGVVIFALDRGVAGALGRLFEEGLVDKRYLALVRGRPPKEGEVDHPLPRRPDGPRVPARTTFRTLETVETEPRCLSLVEARPRTGRLHQVRRHLKHIDHPVIGDANYGKGPLNRAVRARYGLERLALHAASITLPWPDPRYPVTFFAALPADLVKPFEMMGLSAPSLVTRAAALA